MNPDPIVLQGPNELLILTDVSSWAQNIFPNNYVFKNILYLKKNAMIYIINNKKIIEITQLIVLINLF